MGCFLCSLFFELRKKPLGKVFKIQDLFEEVPCFLCEIQTQLMKAAGNYMVI